MQRKKYNTGLYQMVFHCFQNKHSLPVTWERMLTFKQWIEKPRPEEDYEGLVWKKDFSIVLKGTKEQVLICS